MRSGPLIFGGALAAAGAACADRALPPLPEVLVIIDTDMPVPRAVARLRIDVYDERGRWFDTRDVALAAKADWPASFGVHREDESATATVFVRLRAYPEGAIRDYRGERFADWGESLAPPKRTDVPRLVEGAIDRTPESEPEPLVTVDRVVAVRLQPERSGAAFILLTGTCAGTMTRFGATPEPALALGMGDAASCVATEKEREPVVPRDASDDGRLPPTRAGSFGPDEPCLSGDGVEATETHDARACVPGGVVLLGDRRLLVTPYIPSTPERTFRISRFWMDVHETSVARFRNALARGFVPPRVPTAREADLGTTATDTCSWSGASRGREDLPITCITWPTARAYCKFQGGDLPTEAQWEYVASAAGQRFETMYPWGDDEPTCDRAVYERLPGVYEECAAAGVGPSGVTSLVNDVNPLGVMGLGGNVSEWVRDLFVTYDSPCWSRASVTDPVCEDPGKERVLRGGSWVSPDFFVRTPMRQGHDGAGQLSFEGVRCVYSTR